MKIKRLKILMLILVAGLLSQSCATILGGKTNTLVFSEKSNTAAEVYIDGELVGDAPGKIKLPKEKIQHGSTLVVKAEGYEDMEYLILRKQHKLYTVVGVVAGFAIPLGIDYATGNLYRPVPRTFEYELVKK